MLTRILVLAAAAAALITSPAAADHASFDCAFESVSQETVTGPDTFVGVAYGYIVSPTPEEAVSIRCIVMVNNVEQASTNPAAGTTVAVAAGRVTYVAGEHDVIELCAEWSAGTEYGGIDCPASIPTQFPPQEFYDLVNGLLGLIWDLGANPPVCEMVRNLQPGVPGVLDIENDGDVTLAGTPLWECPPYDS